MTTVYGIARGTALTSVLLLVLWQVPHVQESSANLVLIGSCFGLAARTLRHGAKRNLVG